MAEERGTSPFQVREAATFAALLDAARQRQSAAEARSPAPPRFLMEGARAMAAHMAMTEDRVRDCLPSMALWQLYLPAAIGNQAWDFASVRDRMPWSYDRLQTALAALEDRPQVIGTVFHMAAFPLVCVLIGAVWRDLHRGPLHLLVSGRNVGWLSLPANRWVGDAVEVLTTDGPGLRRLVTGLKAGSVRRLLILADGPQAPGTAGVRALDGISPALGIRTTLLARLHAAGVPLIPIVHAWERDRLVVTPRPPLDPAALTEAESLDGVVRHLEDLLRRHPEQWLNWNAARIRT